MIQGQWRGRPADSLWNSSSEQRGRWGKLLTITVDVRLSHSWRRLKLLERTPWSAQHCDYVPYDASSDPINLHTQTTQLMLIIHVDNSCLAGRRIDPRSFSLSVCLSPSDQSPLPLMKLSLRVAVPSIKQLDMHYWGFMNHRVCVSQPFRQWVSHCTQQIHTQVMHAHVVRYSAAFPRSPTTFMLYKV